MHACIFGFFAISLFELILTAFGPKITVLNISKLTELLHAIGKKTKAKICLIHTYKVLKSPKRYNVQSWCATKELLNDGQSFEDKK